MARPKYFDPDGICIVSGRRGVDLHHLKARGMGGRHDSRFDEPWNLMPLWHPLHVEIEKIGILNFLKKYPDAKAWMERMGWEFEPTFKKWFHPRGRAE